MAKISLQADIRARSEIGRKPMSIELALGAIEADVAALRYWLKIDPATPMLREVGYRLRDVGAYLIRQAEARRPSVQLHQRNRSRGAQ
jgi:hypothetical protein